ncbi:MAG TPA: ROK family transcriptional regulator [Solirubrobacterales bacterium]
MSNRLDNAMAGDVRQINRRRVLEVLLAHLDEGVTQPAIEEATRLSRSSVSAILRDLQPVMRPENGSIPLAPSRGGRPARLFHLSEDFGVIGIEFGRTHVRVGVQRLTGQEPDEGEILSRENLDIDVPREPDPALDLAAELVDSLLSRPRAPSAIAGVCIALAAPVNTDGRVRMGPFQAWSDLDLGSELVERLGHGMRSSPKTPRVLIDNDANLALRAELRWGAARGVANAIYLKWSAGIGAASCVNGVVIRGHGGVGGEIGHTKVLDAGTDAKCEWCHRHCLESVASLGALGVSAAELAAIAIDSSHPQRARIEREVEDAAALVGSTLAPMVNALNPRLVIVGGLCPELFPDAALGPLRSMIEGSVFPPIARDMRICPSIQKRGSGLVGTFATVIDELVPDYLLSVAENRAFAGL